MNWSRKPPENCPNGAVCMEDSEETRVLKRRSSDKNEWIRWVLGALLTITLMIASGAFGFVLNHEGRVSKLEDASITATRIDIEIKTALDRRDDLWEKRMARIEEKIDKVLDRRR